MLPFHTGPLRAEHRILRAITDGRKKAKSLQKCNGFLSLELESLIDGVDTCDAATDENFRIRAMLLFMQHDYVGRRDVALQTGAGLPASSSPDSSIE